MATAIGRRDDRRIGIQAYALLAAGVFDRPIRPRRSSPSGLNAFSTGSKR
jgi:hypothetical protein